MSFDPQDENDHKNPFEKAFDKLSETFKRAGQQSQEKDKDAFFRAIQKNRTADLKKILDTGFDPNACDAQGQTGLHVAALNKALDAARLLIEHGANPARGIEDQPERVPLQDAVLNNDSGMTKLLVKSGGYFPGVSVDGWTLLHRACEKGFILVVDALLQGGADGNEKTGNGTTPLLIAAKAGNIALVDLLLTFPNIVGSIGDHFVSTDPQELTALHVAILRGRKDIVTAMIEKGVNINHRNGNGKMPLFFAIDTGDIELVRLLIEAGADVNATDACLFTPLSYACMTPKFNDDQKGAGIIRLLLESGADADIQTEQGLTPLHILLISRRTMDAFSALLDYPIDLELIDDGGNTPLHLATSQYNNIVRLQTLVQAGANINAQNKLTGYTPLIMAVLHNNKNCLRELLQLGADARLCDNQGKSALSYAREKNNTEIIQMLEQALKENFTPPKDGPRPPSP